MVLTLFLRSRLKIVLQNSLGAVSQPGNVKLYFVENQLNEHRQRNNINLFKFETGHFTCGLNGSDTILAVTVEDRVAE